MEKIQNAIEAITYKTKKFPKEAFQIIEKNPEEAKPYLYEAIQYAIKEKDNLDEKYMLHFYAMYLLGQFSDKKVFEKIIELVSLDPDTVDALIGDAITSGLKDILYNTYNGNLALLKSSIENPKIDDFVRSSMLDVMAQLYVDEILPREEWQEFLKKLVHTNDLGEYIYNSVLGVICKCHFVDMITEIQYLFAEELIDYYVYGTYDDCIDIIFRYDKEGDTFCQTPISVSKGLRKWAMFEEDESINENLDFGKLLRAADKNYENSFSSKVKIGRNDPCPCGSGKKYKHCCLNKPKDGLDIIESESERKRWLQKYPDSGSNKIKGRIYLSDFYDNDCIEIDKLLYLALKHREIPIWRAEKEDVVNRRKKAYLWEAFQKYTAKMEKEQLKSNKEYDDKYSIHYMCIEWQEVLLDLLMKDNEKDKYKQVKKYYKL